ncbi:MAG: uracil phosphoribosyltransferase [Thermaerobacter sp.]|nr:uracil phosphoribosyltransferase [Thermaerobacter sp.]
MLTVLDHPLLAVHLTALRDRTTGAAAFRGHLDAMGRLMAYPVLAGLSLRDVWVQTPLAPAPGVVLAAQPVLVPILRAGLGLLDAFCAAAPGASVSHLGLYRDDAAHQPVAYFENFPPAWSGRPVVVLDPMLATGGSLAAALGKLTQWGARDVVVAVVLAAPAGIGRIEREYPSVRLFVAAVDDGLDERDFILPGLGDAGDRQYGTP